MTARYYVLAHVRPDGSEDVFDPFTLAVNADDDEDAVLDAAKAAAKEKGWDCDRIEIIRREDIPSDLSCANGETSSEVARRSPPPTLNPREQRAATIIERIKITQSAFELQMKNLIKDIERLARLP